jgi:class 3 adenylate cyclase/HAMP domain-containing protein
VKHLSIQSKLILALLLVSLFSVLIVTVIGYVRARDAFSAMTQNQLLGQRVAKTNVLESLLSNMRNQARSLADSRTGVAAMQEFADAFRTLEDVHIDPALDDKLRAFYAESFLPALAATSGGEPMLDSYLPRAAAARYLQYHYIANSPEPYEQGHKLDAAPDGSRWSLLHRQYHPFFDRVAKTFGFSDIMLVDAQSLHIVYTYQKTVELGTNLNNGRYADTNLGEALRALKERPAADGFRLADFQFYVPNLGRPAAFLIASITDNHRVIGFVVFQFPVDEVNRVMTGDGSWEKEGLGKTGEVYLVGMDRLLRSPSRFYAQDPIGFLVELREQGVTESVIRQIERQQTTILALEADTESVDAALMGKEGIMPAMRDYRNVAVVSAYGPVDVDSVRWAVIAEMDVEEAYAPLETFSEDILVSASALALITSLLALWIARALTRPIVRLAEGARRVAAGDTELNVQVESRDELRDLVDAFTGMTQSLKGKTEALEQKVQENEGLLLSILPAPAAARLREGDADADQSYADVSVLFAHFSGLDGDPDGLRAALRELVAAFDDAAEQAGVEKMSSAGGAYFAVCGLSVQRPDHLSRVLDLAQNMLGIVRRFNAERSLHLSVEIGINAGPVVGGIVGRQKFIYDLWGDTVSIARGLRGTESMAILVTDEVRSRLVGVREFASAPAVQVDHKGAVPTWRLLD